MTTRIKPGEWTGWPPLLLEAAVDGNRIAVKITIGNLTFRDEEPSVYPRAQAPLMVKDLMGQMMRFMTTHYLQQIEASLREASEEEGWK